MTRLTWPSRLDVRFLRAVVRYRGYVVRSLREPVRNLRLI